MNNVGTEGWASGGRARRGGAGACGCGSEIVVGVREGWVVLSRDLRKLVVVC